MYIHFPQRERQHATSYIYGWKDNKGRDDLEGQYGEQKYRLEVREVICVTGKAVALSQ